MTARGTRRDVATGPADVTGETTGPEHTGTIGTTGHTAAHTATGAAVTERVRDDSPESLREEIEHTRRELGETVAALAAKADVRSQAKGMLSSATAHAGRLARAKTHRTRRGTAPDAGPGRGHAAARGGLLTAAAVALALLTLLRRRRTGRVPGLARTTGRGTTARLGARLGGTRTRGALRGVRGMKGVASVPGIRTGRTGLLGGTRRVAPGLHVRRGRGTSLPGLVRGGSRKGRGSVLGGVRRVAPGLHVRAGRGGFIPGLARGVTRVGGSASLPGVRGKGRVGVLGGTRRVAPGLHVRAARGGFGPRRAMTGRRRGGYLR